MVDMTSSDRVNPAAAACAWSDLALFLRAWVAAPLAIAAQAPSGRALSRAMTAAAAGAAAEGLVVEFGAGTGPVTAALIAAGVAERRLVLVEAHAPFAALLRARHPAARVVEADARAVPELFARDGAALAATVSSLPILSWPARGRLRFARRCLRLARGGPFVQFTYFPGSPVPLEGRALLGLATPMIWRNLWPARVWTYRETDRVTGAGAGANRGAERARDGAGPSETTP